MSNTALISFFCPDRIGIVASVAGRLFDLGANLGDTTFAVLGSGAKFTTVCELPDALSLQELEDELSGLTELENAQLTVAPFELSLEQGPSARITHRIKVAGGDRPGLIARLCEVFIQFKANIVRLNAVRNPEDKDDMYVIRIGVWIPEDNIKSCLATVANTAGGLGLECSWQDVRARPGS
ncbi:MAG TPA: amino acid-binding protein [Rhodospirillales bacterium]|nr:amino acid-binding protein [Rhodospirillales bacterium]